MLVDFMEDYQNDHIIEQKYVVSKYKFANIVKRKINKF